jgi:hypothetical protein
MWRSVHACWFERLLGELQFELWMGNAAEILFAKGAKKDGALGANE